MEGQNNSHRVVTTEDHTGPKEHKKGARCNRAASSFFLFGLAGFRGLFRAGGLLIEDLRDGILQAGHQIAVEVHGDLD